MVPVVGAVVSHCAVLAVISLAVMLTAYPTVGVAPYYIKQRGCGSYLQ